MTADMLRRAAASIRGEWDGGRGTAWHRERDFHLAVADWLDVVARRWPTGRSSVTRERANAVAVAAAYLGEQP